MGKGKGGGGSLGQAPQVNVPPQIGQIGNTLSNAGASAYALSQNVGGGNTGNYWINQMKQQMGGEQAQIPQEQAALSPFNAQQAQLYGQGQDIFNELNYGGQGISSQQNTWVNQQTNSSQSAIKNQLAAMGLGSSTQGAELSGEIGLQGAATKGQLQQGNIGLQQTSLSQLEGLATNTATMNEQTLGQMFNQYSGLAQQNSGVQNQFFNQSLGAYGQSLNAYNSILQASEDQAGLQNQRDLAQFQASSSAQQQGSSSLMSGLGSIVGLLGGGGGGAAGAAGGAAGAIPGVGSILGSAGGAIGGAASGIGSGIGAIASVAGALFCEVAREVYGITDPKWIKFRSWMLYSAPRWLRPIYISNARPVATFLRRNGLFKPVFRVLMDFAISRDENRR